MYRHPAPNKSSQQRAYSTDVVVDVPQSSLRHAVGALFATRAIFATLDER